MSKGAFGNIVAKEDNVGDKVFSSLNNGYCPLNDGFSVIWIRLTLNMQILQI